METALKAPTSTSLIQASDVSTGIMLKTLDYDTLATSVTEEQKQKFASLTKDIIVTNPHSIQSYGQDVNRIIARQADDLLDKTSASRMADVVVLTNQLLEEIGGLDHPATVDKKENRFFAIIKSIPGVKYMFKKVEHELIKTNSVGKNVDEIAKKIESLKVVAMSNNSSLEQMAVNTVQYVAEIQERILALTVLKKELEQDIANMESAEFCNLDELQAKRNTLNAITKRLADMQMTEFVLKQNYQQIGAMMGCNDGIIQKAEMTVGHVIPIWKQQLALGLIMDDSRMSIEIEQKTSEKTNDMLVHNAQQLNMNAVNIAKATGETMFRMDTLEQTTKLMIDTVSQVREAYKETDQMQKEVNDKLMNLGRELEIALKS